MASGTVNRYFEIGNPRKEVVYMTQISDGDTYISRKFTNIKGATLTSNQSTAGTVAVSFSGITATLHPTATRINCTLVLVGDG